MVEHEDSSRTLVSTVGAARAQKERPRSWTGVKAVAKTVAQAFGPAEHASPHERALRAYCHHAPPLDEKRS